MPESNLAAQARSQLDAGELSFETIAGADGTSVETLCKQTPKGTIWRMCHRVKLREDLDQIWWLKKWKNERGNWVLESQKPMITARGYEHICSTFMGVQWFPVSRIIDNDGIERGNPWRREDPLTGHVTAVTVREVCIARNAIGNLFAVDYTLTFDLLAYMAQNILSKWTGRGDEDSRAVVKEWGKLHSLRDNPEVPRYFGDHQDVIPVQPGVVLVVDLTHADVTKVAYDYANLQRCAGARALAMCRRNAARGVLGVGAIDPETLSVWVVSWPQMDMTVPQLRDVTAKVADGEAATIDGEVVESNTVSSDATADEVDAVIDTDADEDSVSDVERQRRSDGRGVDVGDGGDPARDETPGDAPELLDRWQAAYAIVGSARTREILDAKGINSTDDWTAEVFITAIAAIEEEAGRITESKKETT